MKVIHKFTLQPGTPAVSMPVGAKLLSADYQEEGGGLVYPRNLQVRIWAIVDTEEEFEMRKVRVLLTGEPIPEDFKSGEWEFLDTVNMRPIGIVLHVFYQ
jgi:hypothetical protein